ncbi:MAG: hypothetical protein M1389_05485 [Chloroflexi bacterium]|nr:hypothetical protein [Chloroflexota bacterium]
MRYKLLFPVEGDLFIREASVAATREQYVFELSADRTGRVTHASIATAVPPDKVDRFRSSITPPAGDAPISISIGGDKDLYNELIAQMQVLETDLSFVTGGSHIGLRWSETEASFVPETSDDEQLLAVSSFSFQHEYPASPMVITSDAFSKIVHDAPTQEGILVHKALFRQSMAFFRSFNCIHAFYGFYFIIEDLYFKGKTGERAALNEARRSIEFTTFARRGFDELKDDQRHGPKLTSLFTQMGLTPSANEVARLLFRFRGALHHFHRTSHGPKPSPFRQADFETLAFLAMGIAIRALANRVFPGYRGGQRGDPTQLPGDRSA